MFPDFVGAKDVRHRWKPLLTSGGKENRSGAQTILPTGLLTAFDGQLGSYTLLTFFAERFFQALGIP